MTWSAGRAARRLAPLLEELAGRPAPVERLEIRSSARIAFVRVDEVDHAEACGTATANGT